MSLHQSQYTSTATPSNITSAPSIGRPTQPFRFLDLPAEIRKTIYDLWIPAVLHVSLGLRGVRLQHFRETAEGLYFQAISIRPFFLNWQFYQEFRSALFVRSTWCFSSANLLGNVYCRISDLTADSIRHVSLRLISHSMKDCSTSTNQWKDTEPPSAFHMAQHYLRRMSQLQTLSINMNLADFTSKESAYPLRKTALDHRAACILAAKCVADFTWIGLQTRVPFSASNLTVEFMDTLRAQCGVANVSLVTKHQDRYAGQMVDVVIRPSAPPSTVVDEMSMDESSG